jgi:hypothetical protein
MNNKITNVVAEWSSIFGRPWVQLFAQRMPILTKGFCGFLQPLHSNAVIVP